MYKIEEIMRDLDIVKDLSKSNFPIKQQIKKFEAITGKKRRTFFYYKKLLKQGIENISFISTEKPYKYITSPNSCYFCNKKTFINIHHIDGNKENNSIDNLIVLCRSCHNKIHLLMQKSAKL
ncbi:MAG: HNH endonuclease signature motif containing protein [Candidatus Heimdallarchaeaceae archaeon]